jgi:NAD(P)-dependent dehydrogenase (short-subunit alcohol dehydrogenase family)
MAPDGSGPLAGRLAVVVGLAAEVGVACAVRLARAGARIVLADEPGTLERVEAALAQDGMVADAMVATTPDAAAGAAALTAYCAQFESGLDVLVFCGGVVDWWPETDEWAPRWEQAVQANLLVPVLYTQALEPCLIRSGRASVVYYGTIDGIRGNPRMPAYSVSRAGLVPWTHIVAHRLGPYGGRANYIAGATLSLNGPDIPTDLRSPGWDAEDARRQTALRRFAEPAEAADVVAYLAGPQSSYVTGSVLTMDGGRTAITPGTGLP